MELTSHGGDLNNLERTPYCGRSSCTEWAVLFGYISLLSLPLDSLVHLGRCLWTRLITIVGRGGGVEPVHPHPRKGRAPRVSGIVGSVKVRLSRMKPATPEFADCLVPVTSSLVGNIRAIEVLIERCSLHFQIQGFKLYFGGESLRGTGAYINQ